MKTQQLHATEKLLVLERDGWEYVERKRGKSAVAVIAITDGDEIILVEQHRKPVDARVIDLPAGLIGDEDSSDAVETARKELEEEAGYSCETVEVLSEGVSSPGITSERIVLARARGLERTGEGGGVKGEKITVHLIALAGVRKWLHDRERAGILIDMKVWAGLYFATKST